MKLGVYAGSFNPPHEGHLKVINYLLTNKIVDKVIVLPTPNYWDKQDLIDINKRVEMLKFFETDKIIVDEIHNNNPYTYQILRSLKKCYKDDDLYLIIGSDNLEKFHLWNKIDEILENHVIVLRRGKDDISKYLDRFDKTRFVIIDNFKYINVSSTMIRNGSNDHLDPRVLKYIKENKLYGRK